MFFDQEIKDISFSKILVVLCHFLASRFDFLQKFLCKRQRSCDNLWSLCYRQSKKVEIGVGLEVDSGRPMAHDGASQRVCQVIHGEDDMAWHAVDGRALSAPQTAQGAIDTSTGSLPAPVVAFGGTLVCWNFTTWRKESLISERRAGLNQQTLSLNKRTGTSYRQTTCRKKYPVHRQVTLTETAGTCKGNMSECTDRNCNINAGVIVLWAILIALVIASVAALVWYSLSRRRQRYAKWIVGGQSPSRVILVPIQNAEVYTAMPIVGGAVAEPAAASTSAPAPPPHAPV